MENFLNFLTNMHMLLLLLIGEKYLMAVDIVVGILLVAFVVLLVYILIKARIKSLILLSWIWLGKEERKKRLSKVYMKTEYFYIVLVITFLLAISLFQGAWSFRQMLSMGIITGTFIICAIFGSKKFTMYNNKNLLMLFGVSII